MRRLSLGVLGLMLLLFLGQAMAQEAKPPMQPAPPAVANPDLVVQQLQGKMRSAVGDDHFGGMWISVGKDRRVTVGIVGKVTSAGVQVVDYRAHEAVRQVAASVGAAESVDIVSTPYTKAALESCHAWMRARFKAANRNATHQMTIGLGFNATRTRLTAGMEVPEEKNQTAAQRSFINAARKYCGGRLETKLMRGVISPTSCTIGECDPPMRAGTKIFTNWASCTAGPIVKDPVDGEIYMLTAGHCMINGGQTYWAHMTEDFGRRIVGHLSANLPHFSYGEDGDMAKLDIPDPIFWDPQPWALVTESFGYDTAGTTYYPEYPIRGAGLPSEGTRVCKTGGLAGGIGTTHCGLITDAAKDILTKEGIIMQGLVESSICTSPGDSGNPVYALNLMHGMGIANYSWPNGDPIVPCRSYHHTMWQLEDGLNVELHTY